MPPNNKLPHQASDLGCADTAESDRSVRLVAHNVRRLMAQQGLSYEGLVEATGLDARTIRAIVRAEAEPRSSTLQKLAKGLGTTTDELFAPPVGMTASAFDTATNPAVEQARRRDPEIFSGWSAEDFAELASRFGVGGQLTEHGVLQTAKAMNHTREVLTRARVVLETPRGGLLSELVNLLYEKIHAPE